MRKEISTYKNIYSKYKYNSRVKNISFKLSLDQFIKLVIQNCAYCGKAPVIRKHIRYAEVYANGVDRKNNKKGYIPSNCVTACTECNRMKSDTTIKEFLLFVSNIFHHHKKEVLK